MVGSPEITARMTPGMASVYFAVAESTSAESAFGASFFSGLSAPFFSCTAAVRTPATRMAAREVAANDAILMDSSIWTGSG